MQVSELAEVMARFAAPNVAPLLASSGQRGFDHLVEIGLGYLSWSRETATLSGGESQRVKMARHLVNRAWTEALYISRRADDRFAPA